MGFSFIKIFIVMEKIIASKILKIAKLFYKDNSPFVSKYSWSSDYEFDIPKPILSIFSDEDFLRALMVHNKESFDEWGIMDDSKIIIPTLKTFKVLTRFSGSEAVARTYRDTIDAYDERDLESRLNNCEPCYDDGEEVDVEWYDREGDWQIEHIEQITENIKRIKSLL